MRTKLATAIVDKIERSVSLVNVALLVNGSKLALVVSRRVGRTALHFN